MSANNCVRYFSYACALVVGGFIINVSAEDIVYSGDHGPGYWSETPGWETCGRTNEPGARQTPIDIRDATQDPHLKRLALHSVATEIALENNGHTIEQEYKSSSTLAVDGAPYELQQFHFHTLAEHVVNGHRGAMELHAVFKNSNDGKIAVVAQLFDIGQSNRFLERLMEAGLPKKSGDHIHSDHTVDLMDALTDTGAYYTYAGSLTTPPCSEVVTWFVLKRVATLSNDQFKAFDAILGNNFRPLQDRNGRVVRSTIGPDK